MTEKPTAIEPTVSVATDADAVAHAATEGAQPDTPAASPEMADTDTLPLPATQVRRNKAARCKPGKCTWAAWLLLVLLGGALGAAFWQQQQAFDQLSRALAGRIDSVAASSGTAAGDASQALALARSQSATIQRLQTSLAEMHAQYQALQGAWDQLNHTASQTVLLNDVEQLLTQANQQLRLGGHVGNAIVALELAQARLGQADRAEWAALQQAIEGDLATLRAVPVVNVAALAARVDRLIDLTARAPLLAADVVAPEQAADAADVALPDTSPSMPADASWWQRARGELDFRSERALRTLGREMRGLIHIRRVEDANVLLLAPEQTAQLRATLRMRLLTAQLALLLHQPAVWQSELATVGAALAANYDARAVDTMVAVQLARELGELDVTVTLPSLDASLKALAALRSADARSSSGEE